MSLVRTAAAAAAIVLTIGASAFAQSSGSTGAIIGKVTDESNAVLPGVTVTLTSPALMGAQTAATTTEGTYRFPSVPPGDYKVQAELAGFGSVAREGIHVGAGFTATVNIELKVAQLNETVVVTSASPVVDTVDTHVQTNFTAEQLAATPNGSRDLWGILAQAPAVQMAKFDVGGSAVGTQVGYAAYGTTNAPNRPVIEGMVMSQASGGSSWMYYDYGSFQDVVVGTAANGAEMPSPGIQTQFVSKSGGNTFHGNLFGEYESQNFEGHNIDASQIGGAIANSDANRLSKYYNANFDAGGPFKKDKLWWYGALMEQDIQTRFPTFAFKPNETQLFDPTGKLTYQAGKNDKFVGYIQANWKYYPDRVDGATRVSNPTHLTDGSTRSQDYWGWITKGEWDKVISDRMFFEIRYGQVAYVNSYTGHGDTVRTEDIATSIVTGTTFHQYDDPTRNQTNGALSIFKDRWAGSHNFKLGYEFSREEHRQGLIGDGAWDTVDVLNNSVPTEVDYYLTPTQEIGRMWVAALYAQDNWEANSKLTFNLGLRYDRYKPYLPAQSQPVGPFTPVAINYPAVDQIVTWNQLAPRLGLAYKVSEDGKTVLKANAGRYYWAPGYDFAEQFNQNAPIPVSRYKCSAFSATGACTSQGALIASTASALTWDPNLKDAYTDEASAFVEHELFPNFGLRSGFVWRRQNSRYLTRNVLQQDHFTVPVTVQDPGPDGKVGTADDGGTFALFNLDPTLVGKVQNQVVNVPAKDDYYSWEITGNRRMSHHWSLLAGFTYTWTRDNQSSYASTAVRNSALPLNPNDLVNTDNGRYDFTSWSGKISGTYEGPWGTRVSPSLRMQAGQAFGRTLSVSMNYGTQTILTQPISSQRMDNVFLVDIRVEKFVSLPHSTRVGVFFDGYNLTNANPDQTIIYASGSSYLRPTAIVGPRIGRIGVKLLW